MVVADGIVVEPFSTVAYSYVRYLFVCLMFDWGGDVKMVTRWGAADGAKI